MDTAGVAIETQGRNAIGYAIGKLMAELQNVQCYDVTEFTPPEAQPHYQSKYVANALTHPAEQIDQT